MLTTYSSLRMNNAVSQSIQRAYQRLLDQGHFPEVKWRRRPTFNYETQAYLNVWGRFAYLVDQALKVRGYQMGCYELRNSERFRSDVNAAIQDITAEAIRKCGSMLVVPEK